MKIEIIGYRIVDHHNEKSAILRAVMKEGTHISDSAPIVEGWKAKRIEPRPKYWLGMKGNDEEAFSTIEEESGL